MKKILYVSLVLLFIFLLSSCGGVALSQEDKNNIFQNSICFAFDISKEGSITQTISFPTLEEEIALEEEKKEEYIKSLTNKIKTTLFFSYFYNYYTTSALASADYKLGGGKVMYTLPEYSAVDKTISFSFDFIDSEAWEIYHPKSEENGTEVEKGVFINKQISNGDFLFSQDISVDGKTMLVGEYLVENLSTTIENFTDKEFAKPSLVYAYSHPSNKLHSNADVVLESENGFTHIWKSDFENLKEERKIEIFVYSPNTWLWYCLALGIALFVVITASIVHHFVVKNKKEEKLKKEK